MRYLSKNVILALQKNTIDTEGGLHGIRDDGLLEAALAMPIQQFGGQELHPTFFDKAAAYLFHLANNHPFLDGNKRIAWLSCIVFLQANGCKLDANSPDMIEFVLDVAQSKHNKTAIAQWLETRCANK